MPVIEVSGLRKQYGSKVAVEDVSFTVEAGEIFGILGPNGAGKTTTVECVTGLRAPDRGVLRVLGRNPRCDHDELVGVQLQDSQLPDKIRVSEALDLYASFYRRPAGSLGPHLGDPVQRGDDPAGHPLHGRSRAALRPGGRDQPRPGGSERHPERTPAGSAASSTSGSSRRRR
jgi:energy-coupling factor transporter ATP-binding protein EcfA2